MEGEGSETGTVIRRAGRVSRVPSVTEDFMSGQPIRMTGYLEKRTKMLGWKRFWFVLDGHLLTYYKNEADYEALGPFAGSINLGIVTTVRPLKGKGFPLQIQTRTHSYYLRAGDKSLLEEWVLALQETTSVPHSISSPVWADPGVQFYRYSFAALSQWSLESADEIPGSVPHLPPLNFYLKHERSSGLKKGKSNSMAALPTRSAERSSPSVPPSRVREASSMLLLESSPQASQLRNELARTLSAGQTGSRKGAGIGQIDFSKVRLKKTGRGSAEGAEALGEDEYAEILEGGSRPGSADLHHYETLEFGENNNGGSGKSSARHSLRSISELGEEPQAAPEVTKRKKGLGGLLQKIFKKGGEEKRKKKQSSIVITGPVDLRQRFQPQTAGDRHLVAPPSGASLKPPNLMEELKERVLERTTSLESRPAPSRQLSPPAHRVSLTWADQTPPDTYKEKLERFNRISAHLTPTFEAALKSAPPSVVFGLMGRASSCRLKPSQGVEDDPPRLPPKRKNGPPLSPSAYDVPRNNRPVAKEAEPAPERKISLRELLAKKNSAPELLFASTEAHVPTLPLTPPPPRPPKNPLPDPHALVSQQAKYMNLPEPELEPEPTPAKLSPEPLLEEEEDPYSVPPDEPVPPIYHNIHFATINTLLTELETVQEQEAEMEELYDDFPSHDPLEELYDDFPPTVPPIPPPEPGRWEGLESIRHSGIDELRQYLEAESSPTPRIPKPARAGTVSKLGHSSALGQLQTEIRNNE